MQYPVQYCLGYILKYKTSESSANESAHINAIFGVSKPWLLTTKKNAKLQINGERYAFLISYCVSKLVIFKYDLQQRRKFIEEYIYH